MRTKIAGPVSVRRGQTVHIHTRLRKGSDYGFVAVFSAVAGVEPSPHVPMEKLSIVHKDRPAFLTPTTIRLTRHSKPFHKLALTADEDCQFYLMQEVDTAQDILVKGRIRKYGKGSRILEAAVAYARRWFYGDA